MGVRRYYTRPKKMPPTFNFLAGNQEAEENKALKRTIYQSREGALSFEGRTYRNDGPRNSQIFQRRQELERLGTRISNKPDLHRFMSAYQEEAVNNGDGPQMN